MPLSIQSNVSLSGLNTFGIASLAKEYVQIHSAEDFAELAKSHPLSQRKHFFLGGGSNVLLPESYDGLVIHDRIRGFEAIEEDENSLLLRAGGGELWHDLVQKSLELNAGGLENLSLIPGTVGASPIQNIGAYGTELKDSFHSLEAIEVETGEPRIFGKEECAFGYRTSVFKESLKSQFFIASVTFRLSRKPKANLSYAALKEHFSALGLSDPSIHEVSAAVVAIRRSKLPDPKQLGNAGSFFKNPVVEAGKMEELLRRHPQIPHHPGEGGGFKIPAAWLIEQRGWKGYRNERCGVHEKQALVLVNHGGASAKDILELARQIGESVKSEFGIELEKEVNVIL